MEILELVQRAGKHDLSDPSALSDYFEAIRLLEKSDFKTAHELSKKVRQISARETKRQKSRKMLELNKKTLLFDAPYNFDCYMQYVEWDREPSKRFWIPRRPQLLPVCNAIQDLTDDKLDILAISLPPGTGKSTLEIFLHSWSIGKYPDNPSLASGHSGTLTNSIYNGVLSILNDSTEYLWRDVFPNAGTVITNAKEQTIDIGSKHRFSSLTCRAIGASLTGATRCEKLLTADDLVSGIEEALSKERLDKLWIEYTNDLKSRKKLGCKELHLSTRWSTLDVIGRLEQLYDGDARAKFIVIPALDENGESNFNYAYGVGFDKAYFEDMRENLDDASFRALFMNEPIEREGQLYREDEMRRYFELPDTEPDAIISVCDTKDKGSDYAFMPIAYQYGEDYYIEKMLCDNGPLEIIDMRMVNVLLGHNVHMCRFESNSAGGRTAEIIQKEVKARGGRTHITTKYTTANKETKILVNSPWVKEHCLFNENKIKNDKEYRMAFKFLCSYTMMGKNKHDDVPDGFAMLAEFAQSLNAGKITVMRRPF